MLTVIAVIGILAAIAVQQLSNIFQGTHLTKDRNNAQQVVSIYHSALALGLDFTAGTKEETIAKVVAGGSVTRGAFEGTYFGLPYLSLDAQQRAAQYITIEGGVLQYLGSATPPGD
jgi:type IV pilus assembly protein PilA